MDNGRTYWYVLFANYEQGLALHEDLTKSGIGNRIAPTPRSLQGEVSCGMSLLLGEGEVQAAKEYIRIHHSLCHGIVSLEGQIRPHRDRYC